MINPEYYTRGNIQCYDVIVDWGLGYELGTVTKYIMRSEFKDSRIKNLRKAYWFLRAATKRDQNLCVPGPRLFTVEQLQQAWKLPKTEWSILLSIGTYCQTLWTKHLEDGLGVLLEELAALSEAQSAICDI